MTPSTGSLYDPWAPPWAPSLSRILQARRDYVSEELENICQRTIRPRILSIANGRLREAETVLPLCARNNGEFVAMDQNGETLALLRQEYGPASFCCVNNLDPCVMGKFHFIYALNSFNEIHDRAARRLLAKLAAMLHRGGRLLICNFTPDARRLGYMEDLSWRPVLRAEEEMARIASAIPDRDAIGHVIWRDESEALVYLEVQK